MGGGGVPRKKKKSCSEFAETCSSFGIFEIRQKNVPGGGGSKNNSCSECAETALVLEFLKSGKIFEKVYRHLTDRHHSENIRRSA